MLPSSAQQRLKALFPVLQTLPASAWEPLVQEAQWVRFAANSVLFENGAECRSFPLLVQGRVRIANMGDSGRELLLYRLEPGDMCVMSTSCLFGNAAYTATGITETPVEIVLLPPALFQRLTAQHEPFRAFVFRLFAERMGELMQLVEAVAFQQLDRRLAARLLRETSPLHVTHQQLADELGTVREMVSRLLRRFEAQGWVMLGRERIAIADADSLRQLVTPPALL